MFGWFHLIFTVIYLRSPIFDPEYWFARMNLLNERLEARVSFLPLIDCHIDPSPHPWVIIEEEIVRVLK